MPIETCCELPANKLAGFDRAGEDVKGLSWENLLADPDEVEHQAAEETGIAEMRQDVDMHLSVPVAHFLIKGSGGEAADEAVFPHLCTCSYCRNVLKEAIEFSGTADSEPVNRLLAEATEWAQWDTLGQNASERARQGLLDKGIGYVYGKGNNVYRRLPNGSDELIFEANAE